MGLEFRSYYNLRDKMKSLNMYLEHIVVVTLIVFFFVGRILCQVTLNVPEYAMQGTTATLECRISNFSPTIDSAAVKRDTGTPGAPLIQTLATHNGQEQDAPSNVAVTVTIADGTCRFIVSVSNIQRDDAALYTCTAGRQHPTGYMSLGSRSSYLPIWYYPAKNFPSCSTIPPSASLHKEVGDVLQMDCTSELGNPHVNLVWGRTGIGSVPDPIEFVTSTTLRSEISVTLSAKDNGAQFICISKSAAFPEYIESCLIGPVILPIFQAIELSSPPSDTSEISGWPTEASNSCNSSSSVGFLLDLESPTVIGVIAAVGALVLVILATTLVFCLVKCCCKSRSKEQEEEKDECELKEINLVITDNVSSSKDSPNENGAKIPSSTTQDNAKTEPEDKKQDANEAVVVEKDIKPKAPASSAPKSKEYPPPPNYPRPVKGQSTKITNRNSARYSQKVPEVIVYGNINSVTEKEKRHSAGEYSVTANSNQIDHNTYGNLSCSGAKKSPRSSPTATKRLEEHSQTQDVNGSPGLRRRESEGVVYGNVSSLSRRSTRSSPTPIRPIKAPPPPPQEQSDNQSAPKCNDIERETNVSNGINGQ